MLIHEGAIGHPRFTPSVCDHLVIKYLRCRFILSKVGFGHCIVVRIGLISVADPHHFDVDLDADLHRP